MNCKATVMKKAALISLFLGVVSPVTQAAEYVIDGTGAGMHSFVQFKSSHLGISSLWGRFNDIRGTFEYDKDDVSASFIEVAIDTESLDTNHRQRDRHLKSGDYVDAEAFPEATFVSTSIVSSGDDTMTIVGDLTFREHTQEISFEAIRTGEGRTPFGDYRVGFEATTTIDSSDFGMSLSPISEIDLILSIEGIRQ